LQDFEGKKKFYEELNGQLTEAVKGYEKFLQDKVNSKSAAQGYYGYTAPSQQPISYSTYDPSHPYYSDHGYAVPPTPVQTSYGEFYQHKIAEQSHGAMNQQLPPLNYHPQPGMDPKHDASSVAQQPPVHDPHYGYYPPQPHAPGAPFSQAPGGYYQGQEYSQGYPPQQSYPTPYGVHQEPSEQQQMPQKPPAEEKPLIEF
jgi:hypothetical protein